MKINYNDLKKKYNVRYDYGYNGVYNNHNGANASHPALKSRDTRRFKKHIADILKKEFPNVKFKIEASLKRPYGHREYINVTILGKKSDLFKTWEEYYNSDFLSALRTNQRMRRRFYPYEDSPALMESSVAREIYKYELLRQKHTYYKKASYHIKPDYRALADFVSELLQSYSYNHNSIMTDYFNAGLKSSVYLEAIDMPDKAILDEQRAKIWGKTYEYLKNYEER